MSGFTGCGILLMGEAEVKAFLTHPAVDRQLAPSTLGQALAALLFLYREVVGRPLAGVGPVPRARAPVRLPVVLTPEEVRRVLERMRGTTRLAALLLYGSGMRLLECLTLRVKDIDLARGEIRIRRAKGAKDRVTVLPEIVGPTVASQIERVRALHQRDCESGAGWVELPGALARKYPRAGRSLQWQWVFPARRTYADRDTGERRRHHLHESAVQRPWPRRCGGAGSRSGRRATRCGTRSPRSCWRVARTSGRCRSYSVIAMSQPPCCTPMCSTGAASASEVLRTAQDSGT
jgi:integrase